MKSAFQPLLLVWTAGAVLQANAFNVAGSIGSFSCEDYAVAWAADFGQTAKPPFTLWLIPTVPPSSSSNGTTMDRTMLDPPVRVDVPDNTWDANQRSGKYTLDKLPFRDGEQFILAMDDGNGMYAIYL
jgi:hypothetical protein